MSSRSFLYGMGSGLLAAAVFLLVFPQPDRTTQLSQDELQKLASQKQLVLVPKEEYERLKKADKTSAIPVKPPSTPAVPQSQAPKQPAVAGAMQPVIAGAKPTANPPQKVQAPAASQPEASKAQEVTTAPQAPATKSPATSNPSPPSEPQELVTVRIPGATNATAAGKLMVDAGLIQSPEQLVHALRDANKLNRIRASTYQIPKGTSIDDIVKRITTPPKK